MTWKLQEGDWCHVEIPAADAPRARRFYEEVFGWTFHEYPEMTIQEIETSPDGIRASLGTLGQDEKIVPFVLVPGDMEAKTKQVEAAGGGIVKPVTPIPGIGRYAYVADPEGHMFGFWQDWPSEEGGGT